MPTFLANARSARGVLAEGTVGHEKAIEAVYELFRRTGWGDSGTWTRSRPELYVLISSEQEKPAWILVLKLPIGRTTNKETANARGIT
jgi:hypothetical protein